jgi:hypothetical protein
MSEVPDAKASEEVDTQTPQERKRLARVARAAAVSQGKVVKAELIEIVRSMLRKRRAQVNRNAKTNTDREESAVWELTVRADELEQVLENLRGER